MLVLVEMAQGVVAENARIAQDGAIADFDEVLWGSMVDFVVVDRDRRITVTFKDGTEIQA